VQLAPPVRNPGNAEIAALCVAEELAKLAARRGAEREIDEAMQDMEGVADEGLTWRLQQAAEARNRADHSHAEDKTEYDLAPSGAKMSRDEREEFGKLLDQIAHSKGHKRHS